MPVFSQEFLQLSVKEKQERLAETEPEDILAPLIKFLQDIPKNILGILGIDMNLLIIGAIAIGVFLLIMIIK